MRRTVRGCLASALISAVALQVLACSAIPRDSNEALERVRGGVLRVGLIEHPPWTIVDGGKVSGIEAHILQQWASQLNAEVAWRRGNIDELVEALHRREIDVLAAGLHQKTPYAPKLAMTQPYVEIDDEHGGTQRMVLAVTPGESALLFDLDKFLATQDRARLHAAATTDDAGKPR
jgi:hypothetical protein